MKKKNAFHLSGHRAPILLSLAVKWTSFLRPTVQDFAQVDLKESVRLTLCDVAVLVIARLGGVP